MNSLKPSFYQFSYAEFCSELKKLEFSESLAKNVFNKFYKFKETNSVQLPENFYSKLEELFNFNLPQIISTQKSNDGTIKFLLKLQDNNQVECVLLPFFKKYSICLSSQVGCAMNCSFCFTGTQGLKRNLTSSEILSQFLVAFKYLKENVNPMAPTPNIVFMGQGEPLHNFDNIKKSLENFLDSKALHLGNRQITLSTSGLIPGLNRFFELPQINLAISLHSASNHIRDELIPLNQKYPIEELLKVLKNIPLLKRQFITFEYLLIDGLNSSKDDAEALALMLSDQKAIVNLISFNPFPGSTYKRPSTETIMQFKDWLVEKNIRTMVRNSKGIDILAACGQLNTK